jgi:hypothetical protein
MTLPPTFSEVVPSCDGDAFHLHTKRPNPLLAGEFHNPRASQRTTAAKLSNVCFWHLADITVVLIHVRFWG